MLNFELVPNSSWYNNLRSVLTSTQWDTVRKDAYKRAEYRCAICFAKEKRLEAHETWSFDEENAVQKLEDVRGICRDCHRSIHIGLASVNNELELALNQYSLVNDVTLTEAIEACAIAFDIWNRRNKIPVWELDLSWLKNNGYYF